jgi:hypothetical protein
LLQVISNPVGRRKFRGLGSLAAQTLTHVERLQLLARRVSELLRGRWENPRSRLDERDPGPGLFKHFEAIAFGPRHCIVELRDRLNARSATANDAMSRWLPISSTPPSSKMGRDGDEPVLAVDVHWRSIA